MYIQSSASCLNSLTSAIGRLNTGLQSVMFIDRIMMRTRDYKVQTVISIQVHARFRKYRVEGAVSIIFSKYMHTTLIVLEYIE